MTKSSLNPKRFISGLLVLAGFLLFFAASFAIIKIGGGRPTFEEMRAGERTEKLKNKTAREAELLTTYGWVNEAEGVARIPIDRAMELTIADLAKKEIKVPVQAVPQAALPESKTPEVPAVPAPEGTSTPNAQ